MVCVLLQHVEGNSKLRSYMAKNQPKGDDSSNSSVGKYIAIAVVFVLVVAVSDVKRWNVGVVLAGVIHGVVGSYSWFWGSYSWGLNSEEDPLVEL